LLIERGRLERPFYRREELLLPFLDVVFDETMGRA
jgi:hypothetical protein